MVVENKDTYDTEVRQPLALLLAELEDKFWPGKIFRPNRDIRFSQEQAAVQDRPGSLRCTAGRRGLLHPGQRAGLLIGGLHPLTHAGAACPVPQRRGCHQASGAALQKIVDSNCRCRVPGGRREAQKPRPGLRQGPPSGPSCSSTSRCQRESRSETPGGSPLRAPNGRWPADGNGRRLGRPVCGPINGSPGDREGHPVSEDPG